MGKAEVYKTLIDMQKKHGQGLSGIVTVLGKDANYFRQYLDELIDEGLVECYDGGGSLGHPESNKWYLPTVGYNMWKDGNENAPDTASCISRGSYFLNYIRLYLQCTVEDEGRSDNQKWLNPSSKMLLQNVDFMKSYVVWLERNKEQLDIMVNLDDFYGGSKVEFTGDEIEHVKSLSWFKENKNISECLEVSMGVISNRKEAIELSNRLIEIYSKLDNYDLIEETKQKIEDDVKVIEFRKKLNRWFGDQEGDLKIQDVFDK